MQRVTCFSSNSVKQGRRWIHSLNPLIENYVDTAKASTLTKSLLAQQFRLYLNVISESEETALAAFCDRKFRGKPYEHSHFDHVISGYREISYTLPSAEDPLVDPSISFLSSLVNDKLVPLIQRDIPTLQSQHLLPLHILDLAQDGYIDPHVDHAEYSGRLIGGLSLLSDCVMKFCHTNTAVPDSLNVLLPRRSFYFQFDDLRFKYAHEIPKLISFHHHTTQKNRRLSLLIRDRPGLTIP